MKKRIIRRVIYYAPTNLIYIAGRVCNIEKFEVLITTREFGVVITKNVILSHNYLMIVNMYDICIENIAIGKALRALPNFLQILQTGSVLNKQKL